MTRETKIGLLVGLAFIIVVAILLTDHTASTTSPKTAAQTDAGQTTREAVAAPTGGSAPAADGPRAPVPTRGDLAQAESTRPPVQFGPPGATPPANTPPTAVPPVAAGNPTGGNSAGRMPPLAPLTGGPNDLVARHPEDFAAVGRDGRAPTGKPATLPVTAPKTYVAESGDSISKIASKMMGSASKANREALVKANPSLQGEGAVVYAGRTYVIPSPGATQQAAADASAAKPPAPPAAPPAFASPPAAPPTPGTVWYTVKENDNLWRIAARELGDGNLWLQVRDLNRDLLHGGETVRPQTRIRLPKGAATAAAN